MTSNEREKHARQVVEKFAIHLYNNRRWQIEQMLPGAQVPIATGEELMRSGEPQEWLYMARAGLGLEQRTDETAGYIYEICQGLAEWLFAAPGSYTYEIPRAWYETPMGALWASALIWCRGDQLVTISEAAEIAGVTVQAMSQRVTRGTITSFIDPTTANPQKSRRLVRRSDIACK